ncbi:MAG: MFS transporter [Acidobacteria bacterium]|nr:MAG: MFS transporter [Acidobacteriales bacterium 13_1_40CM_3_55_5]PYX02541.1 MAG: MFS transporter [Acidobacteriota bacterium]PYX17408.1 MAG: MFS transporter [Acidobacteriota bacterium]
MPDAERQQPTRFYRWMVLVFVSLAMFGNYYVYDCIAPVADLLARQLGFSDSNIGLLQAIYSIPNVFMVLIGGYVVDRIGTRKAIFIFGTLCFAGSVVTVLSGKLTVMAIGRLIFGLGAESLIVAVTTAVAKWFRGKELSFAFGINLTIARAGTWLAQNSPTWAHSAYDNWRSPLLISVGFGSLCVVGAILYWVLESYAERRMDLKHQGSTDKVVFSDIYKFGVSYWYIVALCVVFYSAIFPFETFAIKFFIEARGTTRELGGFLVSILTAFTMFGTPVFGLFADRFGRRATLMMLGSTLLIPVYLMMAYTNVSLYVPMAMMGVAFSLIPALMWPSVAYIVDQSKLGTAYGLMTMIQNIGLAAFNLLIGWANDHGHASAQNPAGYRLGMWIFSVLGFLGVLFAFLLRQRERGPHGHGLETITTASAPA